MNGRMLVVGFRPCGCPEAVREAAASEEAMRREEEREKAKRLIGRAERAGIPERFWVVEPDSRFRGEGVYVHGPCGTGKSRLASAIALDALKQGKSVRYHNVPALLESMRQSREKTDWGAKELIILDDLGAEKPTEWALERIYEIVDARDQRMKPTVITSNLTISELAARYAMEDRQTADRIMSRIAGQSKRIIRLGGEDRRLQCMTG